MVKNAKNAFERIMLLDGLYFWGGAFGGGGRNAQLLLDEGVVIEEAPEVIVHGHGGAPTELHCLLRPQHRLVPRLHLGVLLRATKYQVLPRINLPHRVAQIGERERHLGVGGVGWLLFEANGLEGTCFQGVETQALSTRG